MNQSTSNYRGFAAIAIAAALWAIAAIVASRLFSSGVQPFELAAARSIITAIGLGFLAEKPFKRLNWRFLALGLALALVTLSYYFAIAHLSVAVAVVIQYTAPALVVAWKTIQLKKIPSPSVLFALVTALSGVILVSGMLTEPVKLSAFGLVMAGVSALCFSTYALLSESVVATYGAIGTMFRGFAVSSLFWIAFQTTQGIPTALWAETNLIGVLFVGIGGTLIPFSLFCWGIQQIRADQGAIVATLEPVIAAILAWVWLGQTLSPLQLVGGICVLTAVTALQIQQSRSLKRA